MLTSVWRIIGDNKGTAHCRECSLWERGLMNFYYCDYLLNSLTHSLWLMLANLPVFPPNTTFGSRFLSTSHLPYSLSHLPASKPIIIQIAGSQAKDSHHMHLPQILFLPVMRMSPCPFHSSSTSLHTSWDLNSPCSVTFPSTGLSLLGVLKKL